MNFEKRIKPNKKQLDVAKRRSTLLSGGGASRGWICGWKEPDLIGVYTNVCFPSKRPDGSVQISYFNDED